MQEPTIPSGTLALLRPAGPTAPAPIEINSGAMLASGASIGAVRLATDLIRFIWWPAQAPFSFDVNSMSARLQVLVPSRAWTPWRVRRYRAWALTFFDDAGNDLWTPAADYYHLPVRKPAVAGRA